jgi:hypothetical protein
MYLQAALEKAGGVRTRASEFLKITLFPPLRQEAQPLTQSTQRAQLLELILSVNWVTINASSL